MPSLRVTEATISLAIFDVVGKDGTQPRFVGHAGLVPRSGSHQKASVPILDMAPPLHGTSFPSRIRADVVGGAFLNDDEVHKIKAFVDRHEGEHMAFQLLSTRQVLIRAPQMYAIHPHASPLTESDGRYTRTRFSCAGFVFEAYKKARIVLVDLDSLPLVNRSTIELGYPQHMRLIESGRINGEDLGLRGDGPWPILLCGYLFHALNRDAETIRRQMYTPSLINQLF